jgi:hypothetical protein
LLGSPLPVLRIAPLKLFEDIVGDMVSCALDETGIVVEQFADWLFEIERATDH